MNDSEQDKQNGIHDSEACCLLTVLWYVSANIKGKSRSARSWVRSTVRLFICLHRVQICTTISTISFPALGESKFSKMCFSWSTSTPVETNQRLLFRSLVVSTSATWTSVVKWGEILWWNMCFVSLKSVSALAQYWISLSSFTRLQNLWNWCSYPEQWWGSENDDNKRRANEDEDGERFGDVMQYKSNVNHKVSVINDLHLWLYLLSICGAVRI